MKRATASDLLKFKSKLKQDQQEVAATMTGANTRREPKTLLEKVNENEKLSIDEQIEYLKIKGITFNIIDEEKAKTYLTDHSYYYKLTAYRKNFAKNDENKYSNVDFATLNDLAIIDMHLRYLLIKLSLDVEHALKTLLINLITESDEDGYSIVNDYDTYEYNNFVKKVEKATISDEEKKRRKNNYIHIQTKILSEDKNEKDYSYDLWSKRKDKPSIWVLIEMMSYGQLASFIKFYVDEKKFGSTKLQLAYNYLYFSKNIRDSSAHSRPIILNIIENTQFKKGNKPKPHLKTFLLDANIPNEMAKRYLTNLKVHDLCALLILHDRYINGKIARKERKKEMRFLLKRAIYKRNFYHEQQELYEVFFVFLNIIKKYSV